MGRLTFDGAQLSYFGCVVRGNRLEKDIVGHRFWKEKTRRQPDRRHNFIDRNDHHKGDKMKENKK